MTIHRFEELEIWKNARVLCIKIRNLAINSSLAKDFSLKDQILRSSASVMDNIAEGFERDGTKEFIQFLYISKGSLGETRSQLYRCFDAEHVSEEEKNLLLNDCLTLSSQIKNFINYLVSSNMPGHKKKQQSI
jgi:four helix bundle protein